MTAIWGGFLGNLLKPADIKPIEPIIKEEEKTENYTMAALAGVVLIALLFIIYKTK